MNPTLHPSPAARPVVVLLHSSAASARQWDPLAARLGEHFEVHAIDLHGHGRRAGVPGPQAPTLDDEAALALPALERAGGGHLIGHSYGGAVAMHLASKRPALVRSLAVYEPVLFALLAACEPDGAATAEIRRVAGEIGRHVADGEPLRAAQRFVVFWSGAAAWDRLGAERQQAVASRMAAVSSHFDALHAQPTPVARLARLTMPLLCLGGERSPAAARRIGGLLEHLLPTARHQTLPGLGHMGPLTHADVVNARLLHFLGVEAPKPQPEAVA